MQYFEVVRLVEGEQVEAGVMHQHDAEIIAKVRSQGNDQRTPTIVMVGDGKGGVYSIYYNGLKYDYVSE